MYCWAREKRVCSIESLAGRIIWLEPWLTRPRSMCPASYCLLCLPWHWQAMSGRGPKLNHSNQVWGCPLKPKGTNTVVVAPSLQTGCLELLGKMGYLVQTQWWSHLPHKRLSTECVSLLCVCVCLFPIKHFLKWNSLLCIFFSISARRLW